jgi:hypothetical protein
MSEIIIADNNAWVQYTATAGQTLFDYDFPIFDQDHLVVEKTNVDGVTVTTLVRGTDYTVAGVGVEAGGTITLTLGATLNEIFTLYRDVPIARSTDFSTAGDFTAAAVNIEFDKIIQMMQQNERDILRTLRLNKSDTGSTSGMELPSKSSRASKFLGFDSSGNAIAIEGTPFLVQFYGVNIYDSIADLINDESNLVEDKIYYVVERNVNNGGPGWWKYQSGGTADGYSILSGNGSNTFALQPTVGLTPMCFGYIVSTDGLTTPALVDANWDAMKAYINYIDVNKLPPTFGGKIHTMQSIYANWISGTKTPLGFYSDSTTDGYRTTGHVSSTGSDSPFGVTINVSPNAYPTVLQGLAAAIGPAKTTAHCYNGGFDSQSYIYNDLFGLKHWYNTWFRSAGSNMSWTDVKAIVLGFGTSDSANIDDTASVIEAYSEAVECNIIDCFIRGVQPILQTPVTTTQHLGNTLLGRNGDESLTIIKSALSRLAEKYNLELLTYGEPQIDAIDGFNSIQYNDLFNSSTSDQVHPLDYGHRLHASYLITLMSNQIKRVSSEAVKFFPGSPHYKIVDESLNTFEAAPDTILLRAVTEYGAAVQTLTNSFYKFPASTAASTSLLILPVFIDRPSVLFYMPIDSSDDGPTFLINNRSVDENRTVGSIGVMSQPVTTTYTKMKPIANLKHGLNFVYVKSNAAGGVTRVGGIMVVPTKLVNEYSLTRTSAGGTVRINRMFRFPDNWTPKYSTYDVNKIIPIWERYNLLDNQYSTISFTLIKGLTAATQYELSAFYNDHEDPGDCYNIFRFNDGGVTDEFAVYSVVTGGAATLLATTNISGINAAMIAGAVIEIRIRTRFYLGDPAGTTNVRVYIDGVDQGGVTPAYGSMWTQGYGLVMNTIIAKDIAIASIEAATGPIVEIN